MNTQLAFPAKIVPTMPPATLRESLMARARELVPVLKERAAKTEQLRRLPEETVADLIESGLLRVATPERLGGYAGVDWDLVIDIALELARGCPSTAWCYTIYESHNYTASMYAPEAEAEYFAAGPDVVSSTARQMVWESIVPEDGGFRVSGQYKFSTGSDYATWFIIMTGGLLGLLVPRADVEVVDTWHVMGLKGTGSNDIRLKDVFVPAHRIWGLFDSQMMNPPVWNVNDRPSNRLRGFVLSLVPLTVVVGAAQGAVDAFIEQLKDTKPKPFDDDLSGQSPAIQLRIAKSSAEVDAARLLMRTDFREMLDRAASGTPFTPLELSRYRRNMALVNELCVAAAERLFTGLGGRSVQDSNPIQRYYRDVLAASRHASLHSDVIMLQYGRGVMGMPFNGDHAMRDMIDFSLQTQFIEALP